MDIADDATNDIAISIVGGVVAVVIIVADTEAFDVANELITLTLSLSTFFGS